MLLINLSIVEAGNTQIKTIDRLLSSSRAENKFSRFWMGKNADGSVSFIRIQRADKTSEDRDDWVYYKIDRNGDVIKNSVNIGQYTVMERDGSNFPSRNSCIIKNGDWLIVYATSDFSGGSTYIHVINTEGIAKKRELTQIGNDFTTFYGPQLLEGNNRVYYIGNGGGPGTGIFSIREIYPNIDNVGNKFPKPEYCANLDWDFSAIALNTSAILIVTRYRNNNGKFDNDRLMYFTIDFTGNVLRKPEVLVLEEAAFSFIPDALTPAFINMGLKPVSEYSTERGIQGGIDLTKINGEDVILTSISFNESGGTKLYQVRFDAKGEIVKAGKIVQFSYVKIGNALPAITKTGKVHHVSMNIDKVEVKDYQVFWGFDATGNLYWDKLLIK